METRHGRPRADYQANAFRVPSHRSRLAKRLFIVGGVWKIVHGVSTGQPTVAEPLINYCGGA